MSFEDFLQKQSNSGKDKPDKTKIRPEKSKAVKKTIHICECEACGRTFETEWNICPSCGCKDMKYGMRTVKQYTPLQKREKMLIAEAQIREEALDYDAAIKIWETLGDIKEAARIRRLITKQKSIQVAQKVVHGDEVTKTEIKDSVLNKSNVGGGSSKMKELRELKEMFDSGFMSKEEMEKMKKEILGK